MANNSDEISLAETLRPDNDLPLVDLREKEDYGPFESNTGASSNTIEPKDKTEIIETEGNVQDNEETPFTAIIAEKQCRDAFARRTNFLQPLVKQGAADMNTQLDAMINNLQETNDDDLTQSIQSEAISWAKAFKKLVTNNCSEDHHLVSRDEHGSCVTECLDCDKMHREVQKGQALAFQISCLSASLKHTFLGDKPYSTLKFWPQSLCQQVERLYTHLHSGESYVKYCQYQHQLEGKLYNPSSNFAFPSIWPKWHLVHTVQPTDANNRPYTDPQFAGCKTCIQTTSPMLEGKETTSSILDRSMVSSASEEGQLSFQDLFHLQDRTVLDLTVQYLLAHCRFHQAHWAEAGHTPEIQAEYEQQQHEAKLAEHERKQSKQSAVSKLDKLDNFLAGFI